MLTTRQLVGGCVAAAFTLSYIIAPIYVIAAILYLPLAPGIPSLLFALPILLSALVPSLKAPYLVKHPIFKCILDYFEFESIFEFSDDKLIDKLDDLKKKGRSMIFAAQPHGVLSFGGICAGVDADPRFDKLVTAAAGAVLATPIVKHVVGLFGLIDAAGPSLTKRLAKGGIDGSFVLYIGGIAELFKCSESEERLFLLERKGFIKLALRSVSLRNLPF
jgi:hypothetical protein